MRQLLYFLSIVLLLNSCATLTNRKTTKISISSDTESNIVYNTDTIAIGKQPIKIKPLRSRDSLSLIVLKDGYKNEFDIKAKNSIAFFANIPFNYGLGMLVDLTNQKRFTYKKNLHFSWDSISNNFNLSHKKINDIEKGTTFIYSSPLNAIDVFSTPMLTLGTEYFVSNNISISAEFGTKYSERLRDQSNVTIIKDKGYSFRIEPKLYNKINLTGASTLNEYLGLELRVIKNNYNDSVDYFEKQLDSNQEIVLITDDFARKKTITLINLKYGINVPVGKLFYFDFYSGFGIRLRKVENLALEFDNEIHNLRDDDNNHYDFFRDEGLKTINKNKEFNFSLGFKFGVKL